LYAWLQQDLATAHTADDSLTALEGVFCCSRDLWPARSPDFTPCDFYLWGNFKDKVYKTNPHTEEKLKKNIRRDILEVLEEELLRVDLNLFKRYRECVRTQRQHFQHLLWHK
jgi:hypothetical protein